MDVFTQIPYYTQSATAFLPKLFREYNGKFIYNLYSPINGSDIPRGSKTIKTQLEIILPSGIVCYLKSNNFEDNGKFVRDQSYERGLTLLESGRQHPLEFRIPKDWETLSVRRADILGAVIMDRIVHFVPCNYYGNFNLVLKYQRLSEFAVKPIKNKDSAGLDLCSTGYYSLEPNNAVVINTDIALEIPGGCYARVAGRSGISNEYLVDVLGGVVDNGYRGSIFVTLINHGNRKLTINPGDKIAQLIIEKYEDCLLVETELSPTSRGNNCLGSTGIKVGMPSWAAGSNGDSVENNKEPAESNVVNCGLNFTGSNTNSDEIKANKSQNSWDAAFNELFNIQE